VVSEAVVRLLPGVLGNPLSPELDSFCGGLLEHPLYTRPPEFRGRRVPPELLSGNHAEIERFRRDASIRITAQRRPDLLQTAVLQTVVPETMVLATTVLATTDLSAEDRKILREGQDEKD
jgi:tRNA (guanine37-N1)-methyltransferase